MIWQYPGTETRRLCRRAEITRRDHHLKRAGFRHTNHRRTRSIQTQSQRRKEQNHSRHRPCQRQPYQSSQHARLIQ